MSDPTVLRPCADCGAPETRPSRAMSAIVHQGAAARGWSDRQLAEAVGISAGYAWRLRRADKVKTRPSLTVARRLVEALDLAGEDAAIVLASAKPGVGLDQPHRGRAS